MQQQLRSRLRTARAIESEAVTWLQRLGQQAIIDELSAEPATEGVAGEPAQRCKRCLEAGKHQLQRLRSLRPAGLYAGRHAVVGLRRRGRGGCTLAALASGGNPLLFLSPTLVLTAAGHGLAIWLKAVARRQLVGAFRPLLAAVRAADNACRECLEEAVAAYRRARTETRQKRDAEFRRAAEEHEPTLAACRAREGGSTEDHVRGRSQIIDAATHLRRGTAQANDVAERHSVEVRQRHEQALLAAEGAKERALLANQAAFGSGDDACYRTWQSGFAARRPSWRRFVATWPRAARRGKRFSPVIGRRRAAYPRPSALGNCDSTCGSQAGPPLGIPGENLDQALVFDVPALFDFPRKSSVYVRTQGPGHDVAVSLFQGVLLRMLTAVPPGKVRLTIVDPVGLGQNFATFMHLADHDEALVSHRIWTEPVQIEQRLADLTEHIETVIQKYLRNEFPTIEAYNEAAGEVAEAFRVLVVANFPAGFTELPPGGC